MTASLGERLRKAGIRHYYVLIHYQPKDWLIKTFPAKHSGGSASCGKVEGAAPRYLVNVSRLMRNLVWQMKERIAAGEKEFNELIRTYWHMYLNDQVTAMRGRQSSLALRMRRQHWRPFAPPPRPGPRRPAAAAAWFVGPPAASLSPTPARPRAPLAAVGGKARANNRGLAKELLTGAQNPLGPKTLPCITLVS